MKKIRLGRTNYMVSELGFGGIPISRLDLEEAVELVRYSFEAGITFFDTAKFYGDSEPKIGQALEGVRSKAIITSKTMARDAAGAKQHVEDSLDKLKTEYIDIYQIHNIANQEVMDKVLAPGGAYEALVQARDESKIHYIGLSSHNIDTAVNACRTGLFDTVQIAFNFLEDDPAEKLFKTARDLDMGIIAMKPLGGGMLDRADLCFKFLQQYADVIPVPGVESQAQVDENLGYYQSPLPLSQEDRAEIDRIRAETGTRFCHRCGYCMPCPEGIQIWQVLLFKSSSKRFPPQTVIQRSREMMKTTENCAQCGECEDKCPYNLPVPELIEEARDYYHNFCRQYN